MNETQLQQRIDELEAEVRRLRSLLATSISAVRPDQLKSDEEIQRSYDARAEQP